MPTTSSTGDPLIFAEMTEAAANYLGQRLSQIDPWLSYPYPAASLQRFLSADDPCARRQVIRVGSDIAGVLVVRSNWMRGPYIHLLAVLPDWQGRGLGRAAIATVEREARERGDRNLWIAASDFNAGALRLYQRLGFSVVATLDDLVRDGRAEILMRKRLIHTAA